MGIPCTMETVVLNMPRDCPETCNLCPPPPPAVSHVTTATSTSGGDFSISVPIPSHGSAAQQIELNLTKTGYVNAQVVIQVTNGVVDLGTIYMVPNGASNGADVTVAVGTVRGECYDLFALDTPQSQTMHHTMSVQLARGHWVFPAHPNATGWPASSFVERVKATGDADGSYEFTGVPVGTYTVFCLSRSTGSSASRHVYAMDDAALLFDPVAAPSSHTWPTPLSSSSLLVRSEWQLPMQPPSTTPRQVWPDLDLHGVFDATASQSCNVFYMTPTCGDVSIPGQVLPALNAQGVAGYRAWGDGPTLNLSRALKVPMSVLQISVVRQAIYTFYVHYFGVSATTMTENVTVIADIYTASGGGHVSQVRASFPAGSSTLQYMRLFCIDASDIARGPVVYPAPAISVGPPTACTQTTISQQASQLVPSH
jgi:hypothetical protein